MSNLHSWSTDRRPSRRQACHLRAHGGGKRRQLLGEVRKREFIFSILSSVPPLTLFPLPLAQIAFDVGQKAVLTSCVLINQSILQRTRRKRERAGSSKTKSGGGTIAEEALVNACFSFTIRRDSYGIPSMIVGNAIPF